MKQDERIHKEAKRVERVLGYHPNIRNPRTLNEYILWSKFFKRDPLMTDTADKVRAKEYVQERGFNEIIIPSLFVGREPECIPFNHLPDDYVIKPNHMSSEAIFCLDGNFMKSSCQNRNHFWFPINRNQVIDICRQWMKTNYGQSKHEWAYQDIEREIMVEPFIGDDIIPLDYKFYMFNGQCEFLYVEYGRFTEHYAKVLYDVEWNKPPFKFQNVKNEPDCEKPVNFSTMLEIVNELSTPFKFVRIDLYNINGKIYFGEMTHYPNSGAGVFSPAIWDLELGKKLMR